MKLASDGTWIDSLDRPVLGVATPAYVAEQQTSGRSSRNSTTVSYAPRSVWTWHPFGYYVLGHGERNHIHLVRVGDRPIRIEREFAPVPASSDERANEEEMILANTRGTDPGWVWRGDPAPATKAPLTALFAARDGRVWARVAVPSRLIPESERASPSSPDQPVRRWQTPAVWEVYSPDGEFLGRVEFPQATTLMEADGEFVWALQRDSLGLPGAVRFRIDPPLVHR